MKTENGKFRVQSSEFRVRSSEFIVQSSKFKVQSSEFRVQSSESTVRFDGPQYFKSFTDVGDGVDIKYVFAVEFLDFTAFLV